MLITNPDADVDGKESDVTIYGATSFVARYVCEYLLDVLSRTKEGEEKGPPLPTKPLRVTLAGRNQSKMEARWSELTKSTGSGTSTTAGSTERLVVVVDVVCAEASDVVALTSMAQRTRVVIGCAGPFEKYGSGVVEACATTGTDYVDITGEVDWASSMRRLWGRRAAESGARLVNFGGFDAVPSDLSVYAAVRALRASHNDEGTAAVPPLPIHRATAWHACLGLANGGTLHTALGMSVDGTHCLVDPVTRALRSVPFFVQDPFALRPDDDKVSPQWRNQAALAEWRNNLPSVDTFGRGFGANTNNNHNQTCRVVSVPFFMAVCNAKVVHASAVALGYGATTAGNDDNNDTENQTPCFTYRERYLPAGFSLTKKLGLYLSVIPAILYLCTLVTVSIVFKLPFGIGQRLTLLVLPPGEGSPESLIRNGYGEVYTEVESVSVSASTRGQPTKTTTKKASCHLSFQGDPGNAITAQCVVEAALSLLSTQSGKKGGFGTPAELLGDTLLQRLQDSTVRPVKMNLRVWEEDEPGTDHGTTKKDN